MSVSTPALEQASDIKPGSPEVAARILADVRQLAPRLRARAIETERQRRALDESIRDLNDAGVFKMMIPVEYGGYALTPSQLCPVFSEIARACGSTAWVAWITTTGVYPVVVYPHRFQAELFGPGWDGPLQSGALNSPVPGIGRRVAGGLMVKGKWSWVSGCHHTRSHILRVGIDGEESVTCQVPHEQIEILDDWDVLGMQGSGSNSIIIREEIFVPDHRIVRTADLIANSRPDPQPSGLLFKVSFEQLAPVTTAALAIGLARSAIEEFEKKAANRPITFTLYSEQFKAPVTHLQLGEMWVKLDACEAINRRWLEMIEADAEQNIAATPMMIARLRASISYVCILSKEIAELALRASGASSIHHSHPLQRIMRDATTLSMHAQNNLESAYEHLGNMMAGLPGIGPVRKPVS